MTIHWLTKQDLRQVMSIELEKDTCPWTEDDFTTILKEKESIGITIKLDGKLIGFLIYKLYRIDIKILNFGIHPNHRNIGAGTFLIHKITDRLESFKRRRILVRVRESNLSAQQFLRTIGFKAIKVRRKYFSDSGEDAYVFEYKTSTSMAQCGMSAETLDWT